MKNFRIRSLRMDDAEAIRTIYSKITQKSMQSDFLQIIEKHAMGEEDACFVAELDGQVVGFMISYILTMGFGISKSAWIATLGVDPHHMGQGIGELMAKEVFNFYRSEGIAHVYTSVRWDSTDLLSFFKTLGFNRSSFINLRKSLSK